MVEQHTGFDLKGQPIVDTSGVSSGIVVAKGSFTGSATTSGYVTVSMALNTAPAVASPFLVMTAGVAKNRSVHVKGIGTTHATFLVLSAGLPVTTGSDLTIVWMAAI